jgi:homoserine dehydrogenase
VEQRVHACMVPVAAVIAKVDGVYNAVVTNGNFVGQNVVIGRGAGQGPTASRWSATSWTSRATASCPPSRRRRKA